MTYHAKLSASSAERWMACAGSVRLSAKMPNVSGAAASEGTSAHALGEQILRYAAESRELERGLRQRYREGTTIRYQDHGENKLLTVSQEMLDHVMVYVLHVMNFATEVNGTIHLEQQLNLNRLVRDGMWGTTDAVILPKVARHALIVADFKYGFTPVEIGTLDDPNKQLLYYAAAALDKFGWHHQAVVIQIIQPRCTEVEPVQSLTLKSKWVKEWATTTLWEAAHATDHPNAPLVAGPHCRWCPALSVCPEVAKQTAALAAVDFADEPLSKKGGITPPISDDPATLSKILKWAPVIDAWLRGCEQAAQLKLEQGQKIQGFKLVRKKSNRQWPEMGEVELLKLLKKNGLKASAPKLYTEPELLSPAQMEKLPGGKEAVAAVAIKPDNGVTVAAESDRREAVALSAGADFEEDLI